MFRDLATAALIAAVTLGAVFAGSIAANRAISSPPEEQVVEEIPIKLKQLTIPVIETGGVQGYVLLQMSVVANVKSGGHTSTYIELAVTDEALKALFLKDRLALAKLSKDSLPQITDDIRKNANSKLGGNTIKEVFISSLHFLGKQELSRQQ
ncbi:hypothetical protein JDN40_17610 [Rhodomicrobium vannielii ATCC 17100]|uniref:hypothetical protein n=1 Tax=Rhodomicrobium vannielii TaxID=1069 RepID=UPI00191A7843|nr:hypothetical protein [Rhodomicrobium vannielii]MBJ7535927.1 hypothetical protein [Rhodomicrobium vannielii ATCC 17100]